MAGKQPKRKDRPGVDRYGRTDLHNAVIDAARSRVEALLAAGADAGASDDNGWTPLHCAAQERALDIAKLLLDAGAPVDAQDANGNTPLSNAVFASRGEGEMIALLRARGADATLQNAHGVSPLSLARTIANYDIAQHFADLPE